MRALSLFRYGGGERPPGRSLVVPAVLCVASSVHVSSGAIGWRLWAAAAAPRTRQHVTSSAWLHTSGL